MTFRVWRSAILNLFLAATGLCIAGCNHVPGEPGPGPEVVRPEEVLDFATLYKTNCAGCHGENGRHGAAMPLANPVYLDFTGEDTLRDITAKGVHGKLMPAFAKSVGGTLTDQQISILAHGMIQQWGKRDLPGDQPKPTYKPSQTGDPVRGAKAYVTFCSSCHGVDGEGTTGKIEGADKIGSIVDASYLALISDQAIRSIVIAGLPGEHMPDWRSDATIPMNDQQITDIVSWMTSKRTANPGQPYPVHP